MRFTKKEMHQKFFNKVIESVVNTNKEFWK